MNNKIFIANGYKYLIWWKASIVAYIIIYCENLNIVAMFLSNLSCLLLEDDNICYHS